MPDFDGIHAHYAREALVRQEKEDATIGNWSIPGRLNPTGLAHAQSTREVKVPLPWYNLFVWTVVGLYPAPAIQQHWRGNPRVDRWDMELPQDRGRQRHLDRVDMSQRENPLYQSSLAAYSG